MSESETIEPFGPPALRARVCSTVLPASACCAPLDFYDRAVRHHGGRGGVLMESADQGAPAGNYSLVIPRGLVRLIIRREVATYSPISPAAMPLMQALAARLPQCSRDGDSLVARFPEAAKDPSMFDEDRLHLPCVLDGIRLLAGLVADEPSGLGARPPGVYGALSYELVDLFEDLPPRRADPMGDPDASFVLALDTIAFDHLKNEVHVHTRSLPGDARAEADERHATYLRLLQPGGLVRASLGNAAAADHPAEADVSDAQFLASVRSFLEHIRAGDIFQGVLSRGLRMHSRSSPIDVYRALRQRNPSPYMFHVELGDGVLLGASPETCVKVEQNEVELRPIAGTAPRGFDVGGAIDEELDTRLAMGLLLDRKEQAEHAMLVDLARNDVARVSVAGTRRVINPLSIEKYSHVQHLVSRVRGRLRPGLDALHAYRASANMGTLTGAPKLRAMEIIRQHEPHGRGFYGGAVGYLLQDGTFDSCIVIRSLRHKCHVYLTRAGAGIVADSVPERELEETEQKARACRIAVAMAERMSS